MPTCSTQRASPRAAAPTTSQVQRRLSMELRMNRTIEDRGSSSSAVAFRIEARGFNRAEKLALLQQMRTRLCQLEASRHDAKPRQQVSHAERLHLLLPGAAVLRATSDSVMQDDCSAAACSFGGPAPLEQQRYESMCVTYPVVL